ncbi:MAG TPA: glycosyltransferase family A protein [Steroidobacteraceae bacterium]|nr:glycosyltransferase family A protein [Steroidobacteraceae bacterium]
MDHTFAIPVFRAAPRLAALVGSLRAQTAAGSEIVLTTSTPSMELEDFARRERLALLINPLCMGIAADWNFALGAARTTLVTLAHQDDVFAPGYLARLAATLQRHPGAVIAFSDYVEHTPLGRRPRNVNLRLKRALTERAFRGRECISETRDKLRLLSLGNPICCPSVLFNRSALGEFRFPPELQTNLDWMAWLELARRPGGFVYVRERLVSKGVHAGSETTATIASRARAREDRVLFESVWPRPVAAALAAIYRLGYLANRVAPSPVPLSDAGHAAGDQSDADPLQR